MEIGRRRLVTAGAAAALLAAVAPPAMSQTIGRVYRVGCLWAVTAAVGVPYRSTLEQRLRQLGWTEGQNIVFLHRFPATADDFPAFAKEIVEAGVDIIIAATNRAILPTARATSTIPIVMMWGTDPIGNGLAVSLAKPGKNVTGLTNITSPEFFAKHVEFVRQLLPNADRFSIMRTEDPTQEAAITQRLQAIETTARSLGLGVDSFLIRSAADIERAFEQIGRSRSPAVYVATNGLLFVQAPLVATLGLKHRIPTVFFHREAVDAGGLVGYGQDYIAVPYDAASFVDKILRGARAGELPMEQPTKFELVLNLKTAKALRLTIPPLLLLRANHVIE